ncbi:hypothetical protein [Aureispira anguillae]|nr:hypothetical protein [Aureispira anguillae]
MQRIACFFLVLMINQIVFPVAALALTAGPSQPEYTTFAPAGTTEMVNLFSGDFNYNIPLLEVPGSNGGYPINLFYNSVSSVDQEASWTGLGWNINIGSMGRSMRGLPDDFNGEKVSRKLDARRSETTRVGVSGGVEIGGIDLAKSLQMSLGFSLGINYVYNNYKGAGVSIDPMINLGLSVSGSKTYTYKPNLSLGMKISTIDAASANIGFSLGREKSETNKKVNENIAAVALNFNAVDGLSSLYVGSERLRINGNISFSKKSYTPPVSRPWTGSSFLWDLSFMGGGTVVYGKWGISGSYSTESFEDAGNWIGQAAYGYNYMQNAKVDNLLDFNREKDGVVHRYQRYLANPIMTYDVYNVAGQGISGVFRPHRSDYGFLNDPGLHYHIPGGSFGGEGGVLWEFGFNGAYNWKDVHVSSWPYISWVDFKEQQDNSLFEPFYYKMEGDVSAEKESTYDYLGTGDSKNQPMRLKREGFDYDKWQGGELLAEKNDGSGNPWYNNGGYETKVQWNQDKNHRANRKPRNVSIQQITNSELLDIQGDEVLNEYDIKYYDETSSSGAKNKTTYANAPTSDLSRPFNHQNAGFSILGQDGVRWNYALPVMNNDQIEAKFSVAPLDNCSKRVAVKMVDGDRDSIDYKPSDNTLRSNDYIDEQRLPAYAHTYLLTSVLGNDYADIDNTPGPSDGDAGYWMRTNYVKLSNNYQWRAPFVDAHYLQGFQNNVMDDLGAFTWGNREVYLPASIETNTHIAYFEVSRRYDARGAQHYIQNSTDATTNKVGAFSYKLDRILLYSKKEISDKGLANASTLKTVNFTYDYSLCKNALNNDNTATISSAENANIKNLNTASPLGKLTLKEVYFTYEDNDRGELSPYVFEYNPYNPNYTDDQTDRWGVYRENYLQSGYNTCDNMNLPYTKQDPSYKAELDQQISAWHLEKIKMPSGATLNIDMERDDYAYVQDAKATRMFNITSTHKTTPNQNLLVSYDPSDDDRYLQFQLEHPISTSSSNAQEQLNEYIEDLPEASREGVNYKQLYYKVLINLRNNTNETWEYVPGYAEIDKNSDHSDAIEFVPPTSGTNYTHARIRLKRSRLHSKWKQHHPISMRALKFLKDKLPDQMLAADLGGPPNALTNLDQMGESIKALFSGYFDYGLVSEGFSKHIQLGKSFIRLNTPDKIQYGGGARVKKIQLDDGWNPNETSTLGVVYDYTTKDENGAVVSSGVLENEVANGYDECAIRWAVVQEEVRDNQVKDIHDYLYPMNEAYHPGSSVGYSKVTVRSLASNYALEASKANDPSAYLASFNLPEGFGTTGETVYEYYTAKDFPVFTSKTSLDDTENNPWLSMFIQLLTMTRYDHYTGTQGYSIELNDMHGKTKKISTYGQKKDGRMSDELLTKVEYKYKTKKVVDFKRGKPNQEIAVLDSEAKVLVSDNPEGNALTETQLIGVDYDFFIDGREFLQTSGAAGLAFNTDGILWWPFPFPWPQYNYHENRARTSVANKIIKRTGILEEVQAFDGQATIITKNQVFDNQTGSPLLATVDNQLGGEIYNYSVPAYMAHDRMGAAAKNWGIVFEDVRFDASPVSSTGYYQVQTNYNHPNHEQWYEGDEFIIAAGFKKSKAIYMGQLYNDAVTPTKSHQFDVLDPSIMTGSAPIKVTLKNIRSGNRNLVGATIAQYSTVDTDGSGTANPLTNRTITNIVVPEVVEITVANNQASLVATNMSAPITQSKVNHVLSASGATFSDDWTLDNTNYCLDLASKNPFIKGTKGVWRAQNSYSYINDRKQEYLSGQDHDNEVDIRKSGTVDAVSLFNWKNPFIEYSSENRWIRTQDITKYQIGGTPVESRDVLGTYQATLYGYRNDLVIAQGVNTQYYEIGFEGFEEANQRGLLNDISNTTETLNSGHLDFLPKSTSCIATNAEQHENYKLTYPMAKPTNNKSYILVRKAYDTTNPIQLDATLHLKGLNKKQIVNGKIINQYPLNVTGSQRFKAPGLTHLINADTKDDFTVYEIDFSSNKHDLTTESWWSGDLIIKHPYIPISLNSTNQNDLITDYCAHTGKYSLKLVNTNSNDDTHKFPLTTLKLKNAKDYVFSAWIKVEEKGNHQPLPTYAKANKGQRGVSICGTFIAPSGPVIEGWQKIEGTFIANGSNAFSIKIGMATSPDLNADGFYIDDIRIFPADGNMVSYVYDPITYKLKATLDDNNYATFYIYNASGSLVSSKKETERGIISIQESRSYVKPN